MDAWNVLESILSRARPTLKLWSEGLLLVMAANAEKVYNRFYLPIRHERLTIKLCVSRGSAHEP